ncbi:hypothetical protein Syun_025253 [Stephania yunnanensis]|uniref:Protein kinase domain-containing protein n=1 Tax=Stephania yunnanensis TaxID=152371 RepID=A0AAP0EWW9_9MAGN
MPITTSNKPPPITNSPPKHAFQSLLPSTHSTSTTNTSTTSTPQQHPLPHPHPLTLTLPPPHPPSPLPLPLLPLPLPPQPLPHPPPHPLPPKLHQFSFRDLHSATNSFSPSNSLGRGATASVFRAILRDGKSVAVKKLHNHLSLSSPPSSTTCTIFNREFQNELQILGAIPSSPFVVSLLGFCVEKKKGFLVYEYMPNRSLQEMLFGENNNNDKVLSWENRFQIVFDVVMALEFLHVECDPPVIHGDIKPSNVLLGTDYRAKISDFGLSRFKSEGDFGVDLFSQELGRSQDLSGKLKSQPEVSDFAFHASCSSASMGKKKGLNSTTLDHFSFNGFVNGGCDSKCLNYKGKEVYGCDGDEEAYSVDHSRELNGNVLSPAVGGDHDLSASGQQWGKDWWWRQDGSGELCSKDYVMEWIGSQICPSRNPDWDDDEENKSSSPVVKPVYDVDHHHHDRDNLENRNEALPVEGIGIKFAKKLKLLKRCEGKSAAAATTAKKKKKHRKMQDWWKEEHLEEISKKGSKLRRLEAQWKKGFKIPHFGRKFRFQNGGNANCRDQSKASSDHNMEFSFRKGWRKKKTAAANSTSSDMWSRDLSSTTSMRGTVCYVAPEYGGCGYLMEKADIYSLGVLILVIVSGRRPLHVLSSSMKLEKANLISWCRQLAQAGNVLEIVDEKLKNRYNKEQASLCINLALLCLQKMPELRPDISDIVKILKGEIDLPALPIEFSPSPPSKLLSRSTRKKLKVEG